MSSSILIAYATRYGSTQGVAEAVAETLREVGLDVDVRPLKDVGSLAEYGAVVVGAALYMHRWHRNARRFLSRHREGLTERPVAIFALGPVKDPHDEEEWRNSQAQLDEQLAKFPWLTPVAVELFGGKFDPEKLPFPINRLAGSEPPSDARDWQAIRAWAADLAPNLDTP